MIVRVTDSTVAVDEVDDLKRFHLQAPGSMSDADIDRTMRGLDAGWSTGADQVAVNVSWVRAHGSHGQSPQWGARLDDMLTYAESKGWTSDGGAAILAHVERTPSI